VSQIERNAVECAIGLFARPGAALEIGCEGGRWSSLLLSKGWEVTCTDIDPENLDLCKRRLPRARCVLVSPGETTLPCSEGTINIIVCIEVSQVSHADWFIREAHRVLNWGGVLVATMMNMASLRAFGHRVLARSDCGASSKWAPYDVTYRGWKRRLLKGGFDVAREEGFGWMPFSRDSNSPFVPFFTNLERRLCLGGLTAVSPWVAVVARKR